MAGKHELLTKGELANRFDVEERTIENWVAAGMPRRKISGRVTFSWQECYRWREANIRDDERATRHAGGDEDLKKQMADARLRVAIAEAEGADLDLAERRGQLVPVEFMRTEFDRIATSLRVRLLAFPQTWSARLGVCTTTADRQIMLADAINELMPQLRELADDDFTDEESGEATA